MDILHQRGRATAAEVQAEIPDAPSYSTIRALMRILEHKGHVRHFEEGPRYVFEPVVARATERKSALTHLVKTFFDGSIADAVQALVDSADGTLTKSQLNDLARRIAAARKEGR